MNKKVFLSIVLAVFGTFVFSNSVFAYTAVEQKALGYGVYRCYNHLKEGDTNNDVVVGEISFRGVNNYKSLILSNSGDGDSAIALPTGFDGLHRIENDSNISCRDLFGGVDYFGSTGFAGLLGSEKDPQNIEDKKKLLNTLSYASQNGGAGGGGQCFKFKYTFGSLGANYQWQTSDGETAAVCSTTGRVTQSDILFDNNSNSVTNFSLDGNTLTMNLWTLNTSTTQMGGGYSTTNNIYDKKTYTLSNYSSFTALSDAVYADYSAYYGRGRDGWSGGSPNLRTRNVTIPVDARVNFPYGERVGTEEEYSLSPSREQASLIAASNLLGGSFNNVQDLAFLAEEEYSLYKTYFDDYYAAEFQCDYGPGQSVTEDSLKNQGYSKITGGSLDGCYAKPTKNADKEVYGLSEAKYFNGQVHLGFEDLIQKFSLSAEAAGMSRDDVETDIASDSTPTEQNTDVERTCQNSGGAGSLGWILCSILDLMANATTDLYDNVVEPTLRVEPELFTTTTNGNGGSSGAEAAWEVFRNFANIIFIGLVLFVIFSQVTGVGIDNYGIKKILPKIIIAAVLINLSYLICLICVDLSNIIGNGIQDIFTSINQQVSASITVDPVTGSLPSGASDTVGVNVAADAGIGAVAIVGAAIGVYTIYSNPALLLTLFISAIGVFIAILFVFILLAGRKAAIVLLTVVSPIAFILYMLPNTKKIYDRWFNLWKAMLLVYPICGLLIGGGNFASQLMLNVGSGAGAVFTAMIVGIVPIFFIPTVIRSAYAALGAVGNTITGFGNRLRGGATRRLNNSDINRRLQERGQEHRTRVRAGVDRHGNEINLNGFQRFMRGGRRSVARSRAQYVKDQETRSREDSMMGNGFAAALAGAESRVQDDAVKNEEAIIMNDSSLRDDNVALRNGLTTAILNRDSNKIRAYQNVLSRKGEKGREHVRGAMEDALRSGNVSDAAKRDYASNLINKWGADYKNNNRSTFDYANNVLDGAAATLGANGTKVSSLKQSTLTSMDEAELIRTINGASGAELASLQNLAYDSLQNETVRNNMKEGTRRELEILASNSAKAAAAQQSEAQAQAAQQQRDQSINDLNDQLQQIRTQSQSEIAQDMGQYESAIALAGQPTQKIRVQMRRDGKYINADNGQEIDISRYRKI